jgi:signal transduction histidine kinase
LRASFYEDPKLRPMGAGRDLFARRRDGSLMPVEIGLTPVKTGEGEYVLASVTDITERKRRATELASRAAELQRSNDELDRFAHVASHDLKAPLRGVKRVAGWIEEDLGSELGEEMRENLTLLKSRISRMESLLDGLLEYARAGQERNRAEAVDLNVLVAELVDLLSPPDGVQVVVQPNLPTLTTFRAPLSQILLNLLANAIKHRGKQAVTIRVSCAAAAGGHRLTVEDDGPGIDPRLHTKIFTLFETVQPRDEVEGAGIGLAVVKKVLELHGGDISVDSAAGRGARFTFLWPADDRRAHTNREEET